MEVVERSGERVRECEQNLKVEEKREGGRANYSGYFIQILVPVDVDVSVGKSENDEDDNHVQ